MLHILKGRISSGKSRAIADRIGQAMKRGTRCILIVPDQATFSAEQQLCSLLRLPGLLHVEVLTFNRLASRICAEAGSRERVYLDDRGKAMLLRAVVEECKDELTVYRQAAGRQGFCEKAGNMLTLLSSCSITPEMLRERADAMPQGLLQAKLQDMAVLYSAFSKKMDQGFTDNNDRLGEAAMLAGDSPLVSGCEFFVDGFELFTARLYDFIRALMLGSKNVTVGLNASLEGNDGELYRLSEEALRRLHTLAQEHEIPVSEEIIRRPPSLKAAEIAHLERYFGEVPFSPFLKDCSQIHIAMAATREEEVRRAGEIICAAVREQGLRYRDFCVQCGDLAAYTPLITRVFADLHIPVFADAKRPVASHPLVLFLLSALRCCVFDFRPADVCDLLHTNFTVLSADEADWLVRFLESYGIRSGELLRSLREGRAPQEELQKFTDLKDKFLPPLLRLQKKLKKAPRLREQVKSCYDFLQEQALEEKLRVYMERLEALALPEAADQTAQLWNITMELFDQAELLLGDTLLPPVEFYGILAEGFASAPAALIPPVLDCVLLGDIGRSKSQEVKVSFILGVNEGVLPPSGSEEGLLSNRETDQLNEVGFGLSPDQTMLEAQQQFDIYSAFTRPTQELWLSYAQSDSKGASYKPSFLLTRIRRLFPALREEGGLLEEQAFAPARMLTPEYALLPLAARIHGDKALPMPLQGIYEYMSNHAEYKFYLDIMEQAASPLPLREISPQLAGVLFSSRSAVSVSRLEEYAGCPFAHFVNYGLRPEQEEEYAASAMDIGNLFHGVMEQYSRAARERGWAALDKKTAYALADGFFEKELPDIHFGALMATARQRQVNGQLRNILRQSAWGITRQMQGGKFESLGEEIAFGYGTYPPIEVKTPFGRLYLKGKIDRADVFRLEDLLYVRIVDYKSSRHDFDRQKLRAGLELQLMTYMRAMLRTLGPKGRPAGAFYFTLEEQEKDKAPQLCGVLLDAPDIAPALDDGTIQPPLYKIGRDKAQRCLPPEGFQELLNTAEQVTGELSAQMLQGHIAAEPLCSGKGPGALPCDYCPNRRICRFDEQLYKGSIRHLPDEEEGETDAQLDE